ncbi:endonuclease domain-containing protein [Maricaulis salignorans]|uniref:endonuclease domain-containing protein n=1 Tax=Maricaulis salignorans TaxID=144026 RepID=UPI003A8DF037
MPLAGNILWERLRGRRVSGHRFKRQHPIAGHIVDFACVQHKLVIELDRGVRRRPEEVERSRQRTMQLMQQGWTVIRLADADITERLEQVITTITRHLPVLPRKAGEVDRTRSGPEGASPPNTPTVHCVDSSPATRRSMDVPSVLPRKAGEVDRTRSGPEGASPPNTPSVRCADSSPATRGSMDKR